MAASTARFEMGCATVPVAESGIAPDFSSTSNEVLGTTPKTAGGTPAPPECHRPEIWREEKFVTNCIQFAVTSGYPSRN
jgi:hypothetical protein